MEIKRPNIKRKRKSQIKIASLPDTRQLQYLLCKDSYFLTDAIQGLLFGGSL